MKKNILLVLVLILTPVTLVAETLSNVTIKEIRIRPAATNSIIKFSSGFVNLCDDSGNFGLLTTDGTEGARLAWSIIMTAYATGKAVTIRTNGLCNYHNVITEVMLK